MELKLDRKEVEDLILEWAIRKMPGAQFNCVDIDTSYSSFRGASVSYEHPKETEDTPLPKAPRESPL